MRKKVFLLSFLFWLMAIFSIQTAMAYNPNWKADQAKMFEQIKLKPGDVIDAKNWQKVADLLPDSVLNYVKTGEFVLKIGEFQYDYSAEEAWDKATESNRGKYSLGTRKEVIDNSTGKFPKYLYGRPFPNIDKNDPDRGIKIMHNREAEKGRPGNLYQETLTLFTDQQKGIGRILNTDVWYYYNWSRPDGEQPNPNDYKYMDVCKLKLPYDLTGTVVLTLRPLDGTPDRCGTYVPALRRVRRTSGTNRSDPFFGCDITVDDTAGWGGQNETMVWKVLEEKIILVPKANWQAERLDKMTKQSNGSWKAPSGSGRHIFGCEDKNWKGATWTPLHALWIPRKVYLIEGTPLDPYYNYGKSYYYIDQETLMPSIKVITNKAGEHWKVLLVDMFMEMWGEGDHKTTGGWGWYTMVDDRSHHATGSPGRGQWGDWDLGTVIMDPNVSARDFSFDAIATRTK